MMFSLNVDTALKIAFGFYHGNLEIFYQKIIFAKFAMVSGAIKMHGFHHSGKS